MALSIKDPEADRLAREVSRITGETLTEAVVVALRERVRRHAGDDGVDDLDLLTTRLGATIEDFPVNQLPIARQAGRLYGKGRHPAGLNYGDCFTYALAAATGEKCLFKGDDFARTDLPG